ncbi:MAG: pyruvate kinase, partial [Blastocatellia bacterium]|nr:pyruvate kinase [Blastocatellia bacterium]
MEKLKHSETEHLQKEFEFLVNQLVAIRSDMVSLANSFEKFLTEIDPNYQKSAQNLLHYLTFRCRDLRALQVKLARLGLSSLGRAESHVLATVDAVVKTLCHAMGKPWHSPEPASIDFSVGRRLLEEHKEALLGRSPAE